MWQLSNLQRDLLWTILQLSEETVKGQLARQSNQWLLHSSNLKVIDSNLTVKRRCWWTERRCLREWKKRAKEGKEGKERPKGRWNPYRKAEVVVDVAACLLSWHCLKLQGGPDLGEDLSRDCTNLFRYLGFVPNLWSWGGNGVEL